MLVPAVSRLFRCHDERLLLCLEHLCKPPDITLEAERCAAVCFDTYVLFCHVCCSCGVVYACKCKMPFHPSRHTYCCCVGLVLVANMRKQQCVELLWRPLEGIHLHLPLVSAVATVSMQHTSVFCWSICKLQCLSV